MYLKKNRKQIIKLDDIPVYGVSLAQGILKARVSFTLGVNDVLKNNVNVAYVSIIKNATQVNKTDPDSIVDEVKFDFIKRYNNEVSLNENIIFTTNLDITSKIDNSYTSTSERRKYITRTQSLKFSDISSNISTPSIPIINQSGENLKTKGQIFENISNRSISPSDINCTNLYAPVAKVNSGISTSLMSDRDLSDLVQSYSTLPNFSPPSISSLQTSVVDSVHLVYDIQYDTSNDSGNGYYVLIELINTATSEVFDRATVPFNINRITDDAIRLQSIPTIAATYPNDNYVSFVCNSGDGDKVSSYVVYRCSLDPTTNKWYWNNEGTYPAYNGVSKFSLISYKFSNQYYRIIAQDKNNKLTQFYTDYYPKNCVRGCSIDYGVVTTKIIDEGIEQTVSFKNENIISIVTSIINLTLKTSEEIVDSRNIDSHMKKFVYIHKDLIEDHSYEFLSYGITSSGSKIKFRSTRRQYIKKRSNIISVQIDQFGVKNSSGDSDISFRVTSTLNETNNTTLYSILSNLGITKYFDTDISTIREKIQTLIQNYVVRHNLTTGDIDDLGPVTDITGLFVDSDASAKVSASRFDPTNEYSYEIRSYIRNPDTLFDDYVKTSIDARSKRSYKWKPAKHLHPNVLKNGTITSTDGERTNYGLDKFKFFDIGSVLYHTVSSIETVVSIASANLKLIQENKIQIDWSVTGNYESVKYYMFILQDGFNSQLFYVAHSQFGNVCSIVLPFNGFVGSYRFGIVPVMQDNSESPVTFTNYIEI